MRRYHETQGIRDESQIRLPYPVSNPTDQQYRAEGWLPVIEADPVPAGMVSANGLTGAVDGGVYIERHARLTKQADYDAEQAAQQAAADKAAAAKAKAKADRNAALKAAKNVAELIPFIEAMQAQLDALGGGI